MTEHRSCASHCCRGHGCKYGHEDCPVVAGSVKQLHACETCYENAHNMDGFELGARMMVAGLERGNRLQQLLAERLMRVAMGLPVPPATVLVEQTLEVEEKRIRDAVLKEYL